MKITQQSPKEPEPTIALKNTEGGDCVRFAHDTLEEAFKADLFWLVLQSPEAKAKSRVRLTNLADGNQIERDGDHRVVRHDATLYLAK